MGSQNYGIDTKVAKAVAEEIKTVHEQGVQIAVVVGGGNIFRGVSESAGNMDRAAADYIGMLATVMNAVVLQDALEQIGVDTRVLSAIDIPVFEELPLEAQMDALLERSAAAIADDMRKPFSLEEHAAAVAELRTFLHERPASVLTQLALP